MLSTGGTRPPARLSVIMAREARTAVVFRRGPTRWWLCLRWDLSTDLVEPGEWLADHVYPRRCDLSPDGSLLVYFAYRFSNKRPVTGSPTGEWTAISRPPWLTPIARWPKKSSGCWAGGGLFESNAVLDLNHQPSEAIADAGLVPSTLLVRPDPNAGGEDEPIFSRRQERDGWMLVQPMEAHFSQFDHYVTETPEIRRKPGPATLALEFERRLDGFSWTEAVHVVDLITGERHQVPDVEWADWDEDRIVGVRSSELVQVRFGGNGASVESIADLDGFEPGPSDVPEWATAPLE